ncbi:hypothetical protein [uncultured Tateyamaria sp.]|uniref:hypothetical protein n=1 Tax=uncultured Tateyamaria sp. TaxID=455651 RepID=UPI002614D968|nr:hypothetical protein [uncultured Tateyamaria sp.]
MLLNPNSRLAQRLNPVLFLLHFAHFSTIFKKLMGTPCNLTWREAGERKQIWGTSRHRPIARGLPDHSEFEREEMYGEPFAVPEPLETLFISWFQGGDVFRSGLTYRRRAAMRSTSGPTTTPIRHTMTPISKTYW